MSLPKVVSRDEWLAARKELLAKEKEFLAVFGAEHGFAHGRVVARERPELGVVVRVGQETHVEERVHIEGRTVLEAEGDQADRHPAGERLGELLETQTRVQRDVEVVVEVASVRGVPGEGPSLTLLVRLDLVYWR